MRISCNRNKLSKRRLITLWVLLVGVALLGGLTTPFSQHAKADSTDGKILYVGSRDADGNDDEIYVMDADGAAQTKITDNTSYEYEPAWSADATKVVFTSDRDGDEEIFIMNLDGSGEVQLTNNSSDDSFAAWAPDNSKIVFVSDRDGNQEIYSMNIDGSNQTRLTTNSADDYLPAWAPDSSKVVFVSERDAGGDSDIFTMDPDGTNLAQLTSNSVPDTDPDWSPDGTKIAFERGSVPGTNIYVMNTDGSGQVAITNVSFPITNNYPSWSNDGTKIAYASNRDTNGDEIFTMNADGSGEAQLTNIAPDFNYNTNPDWGGQDTTGGSPTPGSDSDGDGVNDVIEAAGPNGGDANNDGTADSSQAAVTGFVNPLTNNYVVLQSSCTTNTAVSVVGEPSNSGDVAFAYPAGFLSFNLSCSAPGATATVTMYFYNTIENPVARRYSTVNGSYSAIDGATITGVTIGGLAAQKVTYQITDGSPFDMDGLVNGTIVDRAGLGRAVIGAPQTGLGGSGNVLFR